MVVWYNLSVSVSKDKAPKACYLGSYGRGSVDILARSHGKEEYSLDIFNLTILREEGSKDEVDFRW